MTGKEYANRNYLNIREGLKGLIAKVFEDGMKQHEHEYLVKTKDLKAEREKLCDDLENMKAGLESQIATLGERCNQLLKDKGELTDKIADIKANCDLAIEGRDIKIKELELELTVEKDQHQEEINLHLHAEEYIKSLEQQIEKMKCCSNCKHSRTEYEHCRTEKHEKWELQEIEK